MRTFQRGVFLLKSHTPWPNAFTASFSKCSRVDIRSMRSLPISATSSSSREDSLIRRHLASRSDAASSKSLACHGSSERVSLSFMTASTSKLVCRMRPMPGEGLGNVPEACRGQGRSYSVRLRKEQVDLASVVEPALRSGEACEEPSVSRERARRLAGPIGFGPRQEIDMVLVRCATAQSTLEQAFATDGPWNI